MEGNLHSWADSVKYFIHMSAKDGISFGLTNKNIIWISSTIG